MSKINYDAMSDEELKRYFLEHRDDELFHAYMDRRYARPNHHVISANDPEWQQKMIASIKRQLLSQLYLRSLTLQQTVLKLAEAAISH